MNIQKMIAELQAERERLDEAIVALERLSTSHAHRRGRPPRLLKESESETPVPHPVSGSDGVGKAAAS